jgi:L-iditol 2-dehydrogenase
MEKGRAAVFVGPRHFEMIELPPVSVGPGGIRVKILAGGICGSDLHFWRGEIEPILTGKQGPVILGHEMAGVVDTLGPDISTDSMGRPLKEGDRVVFTYFFPCRRCYNCLRGELNHCPTRFRFRASIEEFPYCNGGFAEYYYLFPGHFVFKVPDELPDAAAAAVNCAAAQVVYGLRQADMRLGDHVVIQGAGGLGINAAAAAKEMGAASVIAIDGVPSRLQLARKCGADQTIDINEYETSEARIERVKELTEGRGADVVMEVVGYPQVVPEGIAMTRKGGAFVEIGNIWPNSNVTLDVSKVLWGQVRIIPATHYDPYILPVTVDMLTRTRDKYPLTSVMSHSFPLEQIGEAFEAAEWAGKAEGTAVIRAMVAP